MKKRNIRRPYYSSRPVRRYAYPNAAEPSYFAAKLLDGVTAAVSCMGTVTLLVYLLML
jgi:hypothetical protein